MALILDLSNNNGEPDWARLKSQGINAVYLKASEGTSFVDKTFAARRAAANKHGLKVGASHFARPDASSAQAQAAALARVVVKLGASDLRPALDFEVPTKMSAAAAVAWAREFNQHTKSDLGVLPIFYTYSSYAQALHATTPIGAGFWLASYSRNDGKEHPFTVPAPWRKTVAHQFSSRCSVGGCSGLVDLSHADSLLPLRAFPILPYLGRH